MKTKAFRQKHSLLYYLAGLIWTAALVVLDQKIKAYVVAELKDGSGASLLPGFLRLEYVENRGMAFGLLQDARVFFILVTLIVLVFFLLAYHAIPEKKRFVPLSGALVLLSAGALGNFIDRLTLGYVVDYLKLEFVSFPVFNLADCFLTWTCVALVILLLFVYRNQDLEQIHL